MDNSTENAISIEQLKDAARLMCYRASHPLKEDVGATVKADPAEFFLAGETNDVRFVVWEGETPISAGNTVTANRGNIIEIKGLLPYRWPVIEVDGRLNCLGAMVEPGSDYTIQFSHSKFRFGRVGELFFNQQSAFPVHAGTLDFEAGSFTWAFSTDKRRIRDMDHRTMEDATAELEIRLSEEVNRWLRTLENSNGRRGPGRAEQTRNQATSGGKAFDLLKQKRDCWLRSSAIHASSEEIENV
jgi:hypothetical protein